MAIKRTTQRQNLVRPSNIVPDSGGLAMAQASQNIANAITSITETVDKSQLQSAIIEAEKQGKQIGTRVDGNGVPIPLDMVTLNSFTTPIYNKANLRTAQEYFKKQAINSYGLAIQNDAIKNAENSLLNNRGKVGDDGKLLVETAGKGYINSIKANVDNEVWNAISPGLNKIWGGATRKASAFMLDNVRKTNLANATSNLEHILEYETNFITNGQADESEYEYITSTKEKAFKLIEDNTDTSAEADKIKIAYSTNLQSKVSTNAITLAHASGMTDGDMLKMAKETSDSFLNDKNVQSDVVYKSMLNEIARLGKIDDEQDKLNKLKSKTLASTLINNLLTTNPILPSETQISELLLDDKIAVRRAMKFINKELKSEQVKDFNNDITRLIKNVQFGKLGEIGEIDKSDTAPSEYNQINMLKNKKKNKIINGLYDHLENKDLSIPNFNAILKLGADYRDNQLVLNNDDLAFELELMLSGQTDQMIHPAQLLETTYVNKLIEKGFIGTSKTAKYTKEAWAKRVAKYKTAWDEAQTKAHNVNQAKDNIEAGIPVTNTQRNEIVDSLPKTVLVNGFDEPLSILSDDENIRVKSVDQEVGSAISIGFLSENSSNALNNILTSNDVGFNNIKKFYSSLKQAFVKKHGRDWVIYWHKFAENNKLDLNILESAKYYNDASNFASSFNTQSGKRSLSLFFGDEDLDDTQVLTKIIKEVGSNIDDNWFMRILSPNLNVDPTVAKAMRAWYDQNGVNDLSDLTAKDPALFNMIMREVKSQVFQGKLDPKKPQQALESAVIGAMYKFSGRINVQEDQNGNAYLAEGISLLKYGQATIPGDAYTLTQEDLIKDVVSKYNMTFGGGTKDPKVREAIDNGNIIFLPNNEGVGEQTYRAVAVTDDGRRETISDRYTWHWNTSQENKDYKLALERLSSETFRKIFTTFSFMSKNNISAVMDTIKSNRDRAETWLKFTNMYNKVALSINNNVRVNYQKDILPIISNKETLEELEEYYDSKRWRVLNVR